MMTDQECTETFDELASMMTSLQMGWVVRAVKEEMSRGEAFSYEDITESNMIAGNEVNQLQLLLPGITDQHQEELIDIDRASSPEIVYSPKKRLLMLINAIEHSVVNIIEMGDYITGYFNKKAHVREIRFASPENNQVHFTLRQQDMHSRIVGARKLKGLLDELRTQI